MSQDDDTFYAELADSPTKLARRALCHIRALRGDQTTLVRINRRAAQLQTLIEERLRARIIERDELLRQLSGKLRLWQTTHGDDTAEVDWFASRGFSAKPSTSDLLGRVDQLPKTEPIQRTEPWVPEVHVNIEDVGDTWHCLTPLRVLRVEAEDDGTFTVFVAKEDK